MPPFDGDVRGVFGKETERDDARFALAVFQNDGLRRAGVFAFFIVISLSEDFLPRKKSGVLLNGAGFAQIGEHGALVLPRLVGAAELA